MLCPGRSEKVEIVKILQPSSYNIKPLLTALNLLRKFSKLVISLAYNCEIFFNKHLRDANNFDHHISHASGQQCMPTYRFDAMHNRFNSVILYTTRDLEGPQKTARDHTYDLSNTAGDCKGPQGTVLHSWIEKYDTTVQSVGLLWSFAVVCGILRVICAVPFGI